MFRARIVFRRQHRLAEADADARRTDREIRAARQHVAGAADMDRDDRDAGLAGEQAGAEQRLVTERAKKP